MTKVPDHLVVVVTASYKGAVGFGDIFACEISRVIAGSFDEPGMDLTILAGDKDNLRFISQHSAPEQIEIGFSLNRRDEPYSRSPISGFVDKGRTSWKIDFIREAKG